MSLLSIQDLKAGYGLIEVLHGISLEVHEGEIVAVIGANGAGKTTMLMTVSGCVPVRSGSIHFNGASITKQATCKLVQMGIAHAPEGRKIFPRLTVLENLQMGAFTRKDNQITSDLQKMYQYFPILEERKHQLGGTLSGGQQQMLAIARALMSRPKLLILDEPSLGLAPMIVKQILEVIRELNKTGMNGEVGKGMSVLLVEQNAHHALEISHRGYVMESGRITLSGPSQDLLKDKRVQEAYLGFE